MPYRGPLFGALNPIRKAIMYGINREAIVKSLVGGASRPMYSACNPLQFGCVTDIPKYEYSPETAKKLLREAGYPDGLKLELLFSATPRAQVEALAAGLGRAGLQVNLNEQQYAPALTAWRQGKAATLLSNWGAYGLPDAATSVGVYFDSGADDLAKDPEVDAAVREAGASVDPAKRLADYRRALMLISEKAYQVPLWTFSVNCGFGKDLDLAMPADEYVEFNRAKWK